MLTDKKMSQRLKHSRSLEDNSRNSETMNYVSTLKLQVNMAVTT